MASSSVFCKDVIYTGQIPTKKLNEEQIRYLLLIKRRVIRAIYDFKYLTYLHIVRMYSRKAAITAQYDYHTEISFHRHLLNLVMRHLRYANNKTYFRHT